MLRPERPEPKTFIGNTLPRNADEYLAQFEVPHALVLGEKSTSYIDSPEAASIIRSRLGHVKIIAIFRDPVDRTISHYKFSVENGVEALPLAEALTPAAERRPFDSARFSVSPYHYVSRGLYSNHLSPWVTEFGMDAVHIVILEQFQTDPRVLTRVHDFLGVEPLAMDLPTPANASTGPRPELDPSLENALRARFSVSNEALASTFGVDIGAWSG